MAREKIDPSILEWLKKNRPQPDERPRIQLPVPIYEPKPVENLPKDDNNEPIVISLV